MGTRWEGEEGGMNLEIRFDINTPARVKQIASWKLPYSRGSSAPCSVMTDLGVGNGGGRPKRCAHHAACWVLACWARGQTSAPCGGSVES